MKTNIDDLFMKSDNEHDIIVKSDIQYINKQYCSEFYSIKEKFNLSKLSRDELIYLLDLCNKSNCLTDSIVLIDEIIQRFPSLSMNEKNLLDFPISMILKGKGKILNKIRKLEDSLKQVSNIDDNILNLVYDERRKIEGAISSLCIKIIDLIDIYISKSILCREFEIFIYRLKGDLYVAISNIEENLNKKVSFQQQAEQYYNEAITLAENNFQSSICFYEAVLTLIEFYKTYNKPNKALHLADKLLLSIGELNELSNEKKLLLSEIKKKRQELDI